MSQADFGNVVADNPTAMFHEFKARVLGTMTGYHQAKELYETAMHTMVEWAVELGKALTAKEKELEETLRVVGGVVPAGYSLEQMDEMLDKVKDLENQLAAKSATIEGLATGLVQSRADTPASFYSELRGLFQGEASPPPPGSSMRKRAKTLVSFEIWHQQMKYKMEVDGQTWTDSQKAAYVLSCLAGHAAAILLPYTRDGHPDQRVTYQQIINHLWN